MLEDILGYLHNWFPVRGAARSGTFEINGFALQNADFLQRGQYYRVEGSVFNDGLHCRGEEEFESNETFEGTIIPLAIPKAVVAMAEEIEAWAADNPVTDKISESFDGYSYTRASGNGVQAGWQGAFAARLQRWRKVSG